MSSFEYAAIFYGIIVGLALQNILESIHKLVGATGRVRWHWMAPATALGSAILILGNFWVWWIRRNDVDSRHTVYTFLVTALALSLLFLTCASSLPDEVPEAGIDLKQFYFSNRKRFWGFYAATLVVNLLTWLLVFLQNGFGEAAQRTVGTAVFGNMLGLAIALVSVFVRAAWWHAIAIVSVMTFVLTMVGPLSIS